MELVRSSLSIVSGLPCVTVRSAPAIIVSGPAQRLLTLRPVHSPSRHATLYTEGSDSFVASAAASIATGWSEPVPGRDLHPLKSSAFSRRTVTPIIKSLTDGSQCVYAPRCAYTFPRAALLGSHAYRTRWARSHHRSDDVPGSLLAISAPRVGIGLLRRIEHRTQLCMVSGNNRTGYRYCDSLGIIVRRTHQPTTDSTAPGLYTPYRTPPAKLILV
jgi:hypothetical protein